jgi:quinol monooxygenase YgiN
MAEAVAFVSHFRVKPGRIEDFRPVARAAMERLEAEKPQTLVFLGFVDDDRGTVSWMHVFADQAALDLHVEGSDERARTIADLVEPVGWEIYGRPSEQVLETFRQLATSTGAGLTIEPDFLGGFIRPVPG